MGGPALASGANDQTKKTSVVRGGRKKEEGGKKKNDAIGFIVSGEKKQMGGEKKNEKEKGIPGGRGKHSDTKGDSARGPSRTERKETSRRRP